MAKVNVMCDETVSSKKGGKKKRPLEDLKDVSKNGAEVKEKIKRHGLKQKERLKRGHKNEISNGVEPRSKENSSNSKKNERKADISKPIHPSRRNCIPSPDNDDITTASCVDLDSSSNEQKRQVKKKKKRKFLSEGGSDVTMASSNMVSGEESFRNEPKEDGQIQYVQKSASNHTISGKRKKSKKNSRNLVEDGDEDKNMDQRNQNHCGKQKNPMNELEEPLLPAKLTEVREKNPSRLPRGTKSADSEGILAHPSSVENVPKNKKKRKKAKEIEAEKTLNRDAVHRIEKTLPIDATVTDNRSPQTIKTNLKKKKKKKPSQLPGNIVKEHESSLLAPGSSESVYVLKSESEDKIEECLGNRIAKKKRKRKKGNEIKEPPSKMLNKDVCSVINTDQKHELRCKKGKRKRDTSDGTTISKKHQKEETVELPIDDLGQWSTAKLENRAQQDKFVRLLGGAKSIAKTDSVPSNADGQTVLSKLSGVWKPPPSRKLFGSLANEKKTFASMALNKNQSQKLAANLESQYNKTLEFNLQKRKEGNSAKGLGFQEDPAKGKTHYIDIHKVNSIALI